jgi:O-antigen/teichoic acid export membrane protein
MVKKVLSKLTDNKDYKELGSKSLQAFLIRILGFISGYFYIYFIVKWFGASTNGLVTLSMSTMVIGSLFSRMGTDINFTKIFAIEGNLEQAKGLYFKALSVLLLVALTICTLFYFAAPWLSKELFEDPALEPFLKWTVPAIFCFTLTLLNAAVLRGMKKNSLYSFFFNGGRFLFALLIMVALYFLGSETTPLITIQAHTVSTAILALGSFFTVLYYLKPLHFSTTYNRREFFKDSLPMLISSSVIILLGWTDSIVLGIYKTSDQVGIYNLVLKLAMVTSFSFQALDSILAPKLSNSYHKKDMKGFEKLVHLATMINLLVSVGVVVVLVFGRNWVLSFFGEEFLAGSTALLILCVGQLANAICGPVGSILQMTGHQKLFQNILIGALGINVVLNFLLVQSYGLEGVSVATAISLAFWNITSAVYIRKLFKINMLGGVYQAVFKPKPAT